MPSAGDLDLHAYHPVSGNRQFRQHLRRHKLSVLALQIRICDPTGLAAKPSDVDGHAIGNQLGHYILQRSQAHAMNLLGDVALY